MPPAAKTGLPVIGFVFFVLAFMKLVSGDPWVVWAILGFLFGGLGFFSGRAKGDGA